MQLDLASRVRECTNKINDLVQECNDYNMIASCIKALQVVKTNPSKYTYDRDDYEKVTQSIKTLCDKHEIRLPENVDWESVDIV